MVLISARDGDIYRFTSCRRNPNARHTHNLITRMATFHKTTIEPVRILPPSVCPPCDHSTSGPRLDHTPSNLSTNPCIHRDRRFAQREERPSNSTTLKLLSLPTPIRRYALGTVQYLLAESQRSSCDTYGLWQSSENLAAALYTCNSRTAFIFISIIM